MQFQTIGWEQILLNVPKDWTMVFEKEKKKASKEEKGYFGFRDSTGKKLEISFIQIKKNPPELEKVINDYFKSLKKVFKKIKIRKEASKTINKHNARYLYWELEEEKTQGYITTWICPNTNRLLICTNQYSIKNKDFEKSLSIEILNHIKCHPEKSYSLWSAPNLQFFTPAINIKLLERQFLVGLTFLQFKNENMKINAYRIGLANQKIQSDEELPGWFKNYYQKHLPQISSGFNPQIFDKMLFKKKITAWKNSEGHRTKLPYKSLHFETYLWANLEKNDIYCIIFQLNEKNFEKKHKTIEEITKLAIGAN